MASTNAGVLKEVWGQDRDWSKTLYRWVPIEEGV